VLDNCCIRLGSDAQSSAGTTRPSSDADVSAVVALLLPFLALVPLGALPGPRRFGFSAYMQLSRLAQFLHLGLSPLHFSLRPIHFNFTHLACKYNLPLTSAKVACH
jgi:hypothetical protein